MPTSQWDASMSPNSGRTGAHDDPAAPISPPASASAAALNSVTLPPRRRNGKHQSCEPCRKAKSACDHNVPKCSKCVKKGIESQCVYHPAPMTRAGGVQGPVRTSTKARPRLVERKNSTSRSVNAAANNLLLLLSQQRATSEGGIATPRANPEYHGPTSYNFIMREGMGSFGPEIFTRDGDEPLIREGLSGLEVKPETIQLCADVLAEFPDQDLSERLLSRYFQFCDVSLHEPSVTYCLRSLWSAWGETLRTRDKAGLLLMAETLLTTPRVIPRACHTSAEWLESFTGKNLRVEMIGNFLCAFALSATTLPEWDPLFQSSLGRPGLTRKQYIHTLGTISETCIRLCTAHIAIASDPIIWLLHHSQIGQREYSGDENGYLWRKAGHVATAVTSLGLHREDATATALVPFMVAEIRKRVFASVFITDKQLATFTGRPPRLSRRYSYCPLPLDLSDDDLTAEGDELTKRLNRLDASGWNEDLQTRYITIDRGAMLMALLRDEVLEVCLGPSSEISAARRDELKQRCEYTYFGLPEHIRFDMSESISIATPRLYERVRLRLEFLLTTFLLERLPVDSIGNRQDLAHTSKLILEHISLLAKNRHRLADFSHHLTWSLVYFGLPSASVLIIELLKHHSYPHRYTLTLPRSEMVQILGVFVYCLDLVRPDEGNYKICERMKKVIRRSLDKALEPPALEVDQSLNTPGGSRLPVPDVDMPTMMEAEDDPDFMEWLNAVDWSKGPWVENF